MNDSWRHDVHMAVGDVQSRLAAFAPLSVRLGDLDRCEQMILRLQEQNQLIWGQVQQPPSSQPMDDMALGALTTRLDRLDLVTVDRDEFDATLTAHLGKFSTLESHVTSLDQRAGSFQQDISRVMVDALSLREELRAWSSKLEDAMSQLRSAATHDRADLNSLQVLVQPLEAHMAALENRMDHLAHSSVDTVARLRAEVMNHSSNTSGPFSGMLSNPSEGCLHPSGGCHSTPNVDMTEYVLRMDFETEKTRRLQLESAVAELQRAFSTMQREHLSWRSLGGPRPSVSPALHPLSTMPAHSAHVTTKGQPRTTESMSTRSTSFCPIRPAQHAPTYVMGSDCASSERGGRTSPQGSLLDAAPPLSRPRARFVLEDSTPPGGPLGISKLQSNPMTEAVLCQIPGVPAQKTPTPSVGSHVQDVAPVAATSGVAHYSQLLTTIGLEHPRLENKRNGGWDAFERRWCKKIELVKTSTNNGADIPDVLLFESLQLCLDATDTAYMERLRDENPAMTFSGFFHRLKNLYAGDPTVQHRKAWEALKLNLPGGVLRLDAWTEFRERFLLLRRKVLNRTDGEERKLLLDPLPGTMKRFLLEEEHKRRRRSWLVRLAGIPPADLHELHDAIDEAIDGHVDKVTMVPGGLLVSCATQEVCQQVLRLNNAHWIDSTVTATRVDYTMSGEDIIQFVSARLEMEESLREHSADPVTGSLPWGGITEVQSGTTAATPPSPRPFRGRSVDRMDRPGRTPSPRRVASADRRGRSHAPGGPGGRSRSIGKGSSGKGASGKGTTAREPSVPPKGEGPSTCAYCYHRGWPQYSHRPSTCRWNPELEKTEDASATQARPNGSAPSAPAAAASSSTSGPKQPVSPRQKSQ